MPAALLKIKHSVIPCVISFSLLVMQDLHQNTLSIRLGSHSVSVGWTCKISPSIIFLWGKEKSEHLYTRFLGYYVLYCKGKVKSPPVTEHSFWNVHTIHLSDSCATTRNIKVPHKSCHSRRVPWCDRQNDGFCLLLCGENAWATSHLRRPWDLPLTIWWCYKIKQTIILQEYSRLGMNFNIIFYTCCTQYVAPMRCFCQILLLVITAGKELRSIYSGYRRRIWGSLVLLLLCISRHEWVNITNWRASIKASSHSNSIHSCFVLDVCYRC